MLQRIGGSEPACDVSQITPEREPDQHTAEESEESLGPSNDKDPMNANATALLSALGGALVPLALLGYTGVQAVATVSECRISQAKPFHVAARHGGL